MRTSRRPTVEAARSPHCWAPTTSAVTQASCGGDDHARRDGALGDDRA
ncbi:MAG: hypothetical protein WKF73_14970 [Nocardioidaceae bacterium]